MRKTLVAGVLVGAVMLIVGVILGQVQNFVLPTLRLEYQNQNLFRPWSDPIMSFYYLNPFIVGIILVWLWKKYLSLTGGENTLIKALKFSLTYWVVTIPGMFISFSSFPISLMMVMTWTVSNLISSIVAGLVLHRLFR